MGTKALDSKHTEERTSQTMAATRSFMQSVGVTVAVLLCACCSINNVVSGDPDTTFWYRACNDVTYSSGDPYRESVHYVLADMVTATANQPGYNYYTRSPAPGSVVYGHALCNTALTCTDCVSCIGYVKNQVVADCPDSIGAQVVLQDCQMRYEQYSFTD